MDAIRRFSGLTVIQSGKWSTIDYEKLICTANENMMRSLSISTSLLLALLFVPGLAPFVFQANGVAQEDTSQEHKYTNELVNETSPYLLMHAHNPVNWYGWNEKALAKAKEENKLIFLSVGYSSCHWCHVMERESFYDEEIADFLNENFVCIKVDREERPDVDAIYMESLHVLNAMMKRRAGGGWPLSMFLTPDAKPFFGGTYFPARKGDRGARIGFFDIIKMIHGRWQATPDKFEKDAELITKYTRESLAGKNENQNAELQQSWTTIAFETMEDRFDPEWGGFRFSPENPNIPKFPEPSNLFFLVDYLDRNPDNEKAKTMLVKTCEKMMMGGIYDHLGGGFHRYSVDRYWAIPHFEKMLYDNGQLATVYSEVYQLTGRGEFKNVVDGILAWVQREMISEEGAFYSALDAESEGEEGKFYRWEKDELKNALSEDEFNLFADIYGINKQPNFEKKYYAPQLGNLLSQSAKNKSLSLDDLESKLQPIRKKLFDIRDKRERPLLDNKILTSWNGMMIRGFADAGRVFKNPTYIEVAQKAAQFMVDKMIREDGRLWRTHTNGESKLNAYLDDYACLIDGLLALHRATEDDQWLKQAVKLQQKQDEIFWDEEQGGYFFTSADHEKLLVRSKKPGDGALPSGNSVASENLLYLASQTDQQDYREKAQKTVLSASYLLERMPTSAPRLLVTAQTLMQDSKE